MGTMEKAGIAVIAVLIGIIVVVGLMNKKGGDAAGDAAKKGSAQTDAKGDPQTKTSTLAGNPAPSPSAGDPKEIGKKSDTPGGDSGSKVSLIDDAPNPELAKLSGFPRTYTVKKDDSLTKIAFREYGVSKMEKVIKETNSIDAKAIKEGTQLTLPMPPVELQQEVIEALAKNTPAGGSTTPKTGSRARSEDGEGSGFR